MTTRSTRPLDIIETEIRLTRAAIDVCNRMLAVALKERRGLLDLGWPVGHAMCEALDQVALRWNGEGDYQRRALARLMAELDPRA